VNVAATKAFDAAGHVQSAVSSAAAAYLQDIEEHIPQNCSFGTTQFCIGYKHDLKCSDLPFNLSSVIPDIVHDLPDSVGDTVRDRMDAMSLLSASLAKFPAFYIPNTLIAGLILVSTITVFSICLAFGWLSRVVHTLHVKYWVLGLFVLGFLCCSPLILLVAIMRMLIEKANELPSWIEVEKGEVLGLCFGALGYALALTLLVAGAPTINVI
jgi:hypothetical protein